MGRDKRVQDTGSGEKMCTRGALGYWGSQSKFIPARRKREKKSGKGQDNARERGEGNGEGYGVTEMKNRVCGKGWRSGQGGGLTREKATEEARGDKSKKASS